jgi:hypothetical protein
MFGTEWDEVKREPKQINKYNDQFKVILPKYYRVIKKKIKRWAGHVARIADRRCA